MKMSQGKATILGRLQSIFTSQAVPTFLPAPFKRPIKCLGKTSIHFFASGRILVSPLFASARPRRTGTWRRYAASPGAPISCWRGSSTRPGAGPSETRLTGHSGTCNGTCPEKVAFGVRHVPIPGVVATFSRGTFQPFFPGMPSFSKRTPKPLGNSWFLKRTMFEKNGESTPGVVFGYAISRLEL